MCITNRGFTLIELVLVILIIGVLAAAAWPRFFDGSAQSLVVMNQANAGTLRSTVNIAHAAWIANGASTVSPVYVSLEGNTYRLNGYGWPSYNNVGVSTSPISCANTLTALDGVGGIKKPLLNNFPQTVASDGSVAGSCTQAPCSCTDSICYSADSTQSWYCTYTLYKEGVSTGYTIVYNVRNGSVTTGS